MLIPEEIRDEWPRQNDLMDSVEQYYTYINSKMLEKNRAKENGVTTPKIVWMFKNFVQLSVHRGVDISNEVVSSWKNERLIVTILNLRALLETAAILYEVVIKAKNKTTAKTFDELYKFITDRSFGSRRDDRYADAVSILTLVDFADRKFKGLRACYDHLSEYCHPNYDGMMGHYARLDNVDNRMDYSNKYCFEEFKIEEILLAFSISLLIFNQSIELSESVYVEMTKFNEEYISKIRSEKNANREPPLQ